MRSIALAVSIPLIVMLAWVGRLEYTKSVGHEIRLSIAGYDPRDLLAGHYIIYRVAYGIDPDCGYRSPQTRCLCLSPTPESTQGNLPPIYQATSLGICAELASSCDVILKGSCGNYRFDAGIERFYIPEHMADIFAVAPADSSIAVKVDHTGRGQVVNYYVGQEDWSSYANRKRKEQSNNAVR